MADFTEEILKREITNGEQMVEQLTGIKNALEGSGNGGGNVTLGPLQVLYYIVSAETENGLNLQTFVYGDAPMGDLYRMNKTAAEIREALNSGRGILVVYVEETDSVEGYKEVYGAPSAYSVASVNGVLQIEVEETYFFVEDPETGYMEASNQG